MPHDTEAHREAIVAFLRGRGWVTGREVAEHLRGRVTWQQGLQDLRVLRRRGVLESRQRPDRLNRHGLPSLDWRLREEG